jgi:hypothetical protein
VFSRKLQIGIPMEKIPLLITSAINVSAPGTTLADPSERLELTLKAIKRWLENASIDSIVVVDGSGYDYSQQLQELALDSKKHVEFLCFQNDIEKVRSKGKGYGEGEIVLHALTHSKILSTARCFAKCTGKLYVRNYGKCLAAFDGKFMCGVYGHNRVRSLDTRFYLSSRDFWLTHFSDAHLQVDDPNGFYIEHSYFDRLQKSAVKGFTLPVPPLIEGRSGSDNIEYRIPSLYRRFVRRIRFYIFNKFY